MTVLNDEHWMQQALALAKEAAVADEVPVGAVVVCNDQIIGKGFNQSITLNDPSAHAEIIAIREAAQYLQNYRLVEAELYVTLEPCPMCAGALINSRIKRLIYGAADPKSGAVATKLSLYEHGWNHVVSFTAGVLAEPCGQILKDFFQARRK